MPRGPAPTWKAPAPHTQQATPYIAAAFKVGYEVELSWTGIDTKERALTCKKGLFNAARLHSPQVSVSVNMERAGSGWVLKFTLHDKRVARAHIVAKHGSDRTQWPYNARARRS
jgi:hypothetical protein